MELSLEAADTHAQTPQARKSVPTLHSRPSVGRSPFRPLLPKTTDYRHISLSAILGTAKQRKNIMPNEKRGEARFSPTVLARVRHSERARVQRAEPSAHLKYAFSEVGAQPAASLQVNSSQTLLRSVILQLRCYLWLQHYLQI